MIDSILWIFNVIVNVIVKLLPFLGGLSLLAILLVLIIPYLKKMISVPQMIKEHADALIGAVVIFILILPFTLWKSGYYGKDKLFDNSDTLGYYGALIGGGVTVLGVYWTLNYESKKAVEERTQERELLKEERRKNSLPILRFYLGSIDFSFNTLQQSKQVLVKDNGGKFFTNYDIFIDTTNGSSEYSKNSIHQYGNLKIKNIGLGTAIISDIKLIRTNPEKTEVKNIGILKLNQQLVFPEKEIVLEMCIRSDDLNIEDTLYFTFMDLYSNKYLYKIPFNWLAEDIKYSKIRIWNEDVAMFPILVPTEK
jgi:hypothetical protein